MTNRWSNTFFYSEKNNTMRIFSMILISVFALLSCSTVKHNAQGNGWTPLFDGNTTNGWHTYGKKTVGSAWKVKDGVLYLDATNKPGRGDLVTDQPFENFDLKIEWKISKHGNSVFIIWLQEDTMKYKQTYNTGP